MTKNKIIVFTIASDEKNIGYANIMLSSFKHFHPDIPIKVFLKEDIEKLGPDSEYRRYAMFGKQLAKKYETVVMIDADSIVTGNLDHLFNDNSFDLACPLNNNLVDDKLEIHDIPWQVYVNAGFIIARGEEFWEWWDELNHRIYWSNYQFREQDTLNLIFHYGNLKSKLMDFDFPPCWHGLVHKGQWHKFIMRNNEIVLPKEEGVCNEDKVIKVIHWAGGETVKMNFYTFFTKSVIKFLQKITNEKTKTA